MPRAGRFLGATHLLLAVGCAPRTPEPPARPGAPALASPAAPARSAAETLAQLDRESHAARDAADFVTYRAKLLAMLELLHGHPDVVYALAGAEARLGNTDEALRWLGHYADTGLARGGVAEDPKLATLRDDARFAPLAARIAANDHPVSSSTLAYKLPDEELIAEDIAFDRAAGVFYVSAVRARKIVAIPADGGAAHDFVRAGADGLLSVLALGLDAAHDRLFATTVGMREADVLRPEDRGKTALVAFDRRTGALALRADFDAGPGDHTLTDMTVASSGDAYVSDEAGARVYRLRAGATALEPIGEPGEFISPQTPALAPEGGPLFVPDYVRGIAVVDLTTGATRWLGASRPAALDGIDGLYFVDGTTLLAVQNGTSPARVSRLHLDSARTRVEAVDVVEQASSWLGAPTHGVVVGDRFYFIAKSGWEHMNEDGTVKPQESPRGSLILSAPAK